MTQGILFIGLIIVAINVIAGVLMAKRHRQWQYGVAPWGIALMITIALIDKVSQVYQW